MLRKSNQQGHLYDTAKTHKITNIDEITIVNLTFRPIIAQTGTYTYNAAQVIAKYLKTCAVEIMTSLETRKSFPPL